MKKNNYIYPAVFTFEEGQEIAVLFPDFDVATSGVDEEDAFKSAKELLGLTLYPAWLNAKSLELGVIFSQVLQEALLERLQA